MLIMKFVEIDFVLNKKVFYLRSQFLIFNTIKSISQNLLADFFKFFWYESHELEKKLFPE